MKGKILSILLSFILFLILYFLQANFFNWFTIAGIKPNLFVVFVLCTGLFGGRIVGSLLGMIYGVFLDIWIGQKIGISGILLGIIGFAGGYLDKNFSKDSKLTIILMSVGATLGYEFLQYAIRVISNNINLELIAFFKIIAIEIIYNGILIIILYPIIQKWGYYLEGQFKGRKILTRYF